jgi:hypothetical protein
MDHHRLRAEFNDELPYDETIEANAGRIAGGLLPATSRIHRISKGMSCPCRWAIR